MSVVKRWRLSEIENRVCDIVGEQLRLPREKITPGLSLFEDLHVDSLDVIELVMEIEEAFDVSLPDGSDGNPVYKTVFTRQPFRLSDLAELAYLEQGQRRDRREHSWWQSRREKPPAAQSLAFSQLDGRWEPKASGNTGLFERLKGRDAESYRRRSDGMRCIKIPSAAVQIGDESEMALADERPRHVVELDGFFIDAEPVSTTAFCRFLNSVGEDDPAVLRDWFVLDALDDREEHTLVRREPGGTEWRPVPGTETWPMILVSWFGANAYSLWANGSDWRAYRGECESQAESYLPSEAQWEYAARGAQFHAFPWGEENPTPEHMRFACHSRSASYRAETLPLASVNDALGMSPFGLHHMAGNVWQWCRDWYEPTFYRRSESKRANPWNHAPTLVRSERGGSWIGPASLCRSSYRRGRPPFARGRCLGFRCVSAV